MKNRAISAAFVLWSAWNYLAYFSRLFSSENAGKALHRLFGI